MAAHKRPGEGDTLRAWLNASGPCELAARAGDSQHISDCLEGSGQGLNKALALMGRPVFGRSGPDVSNIFSSWPGEPDRQAVSYGHAACAGGPGCRRGRSGVGIAFETAQALS